MNGAGTSARPRRALPGGIWALGLVSMLMDTSSELVHSVLPVLLSSVLGASAATIGVIEGVAEATAAVSKVFSGAISDFFRRRKALVLIGYGLSACTKLVFPLAATIGGVFGARVADRIGKGSRGAPRDALIADLVPPDLRGAAYGLRQALDSVGAFAGPLLAVAGLALLNGNIRGTMWIAVLPAVLCVALIVFGVHEPADAASAPRKRLGLADARRLPLRFWLVIALGAVFTLARFSEAFLILRAQNVGLAIGFVPLIMIVMNLVHYHPTGIGWG